jgi:uncharacterized protein (TIGR02996 family)
MSREAFLNTIRHDPDDDLPRLVYADWLEEQGDDARAEFIRVQCELARLSPRHSRYAILEDREHDLLSEHEPEWLGFDPRDDESPTEWTFRRGFLADVRVHFLEPDSDWLQQHFLTDLTLGYHIPSIEFEWIAHTNWFQFLTCYTSINSNFVNEQLSVLAENPEPMNLREVRFHGLDGTEHGHSRVAMFASSKQLLKLRFVGLEGYSVSDGEAGFLLNSERFSLTGLSLGQNELLSSRGIEILADSPALRRLNFLSLRNTPGIGGSAMMMLAQSPYLSPLCELDITGCGADEATRAALRMRLGNRLTD